MPVAVTINAGKYRTAIGLLLERGGSFQTRHERTLIVSSEQKRLLEEAGLVEFQVKKGQARNGHRKGVR